MSDSTDTSEIICLTSQKTTNPPHKNTLLSKLHKESTRDPETSTSIIECPWEIKMNPIAINIAKPKDEIVVEYLDPLFHGYSFHIPESMGYLFQNIQSCTFTFKFSANNKLYVWKESEILRTINVVNYGDELLFDQDMIFMLHRKKYLAKEKRKENVEYKQSLKNKEKFKQNSVIKEYTKSLYELQVSEHINIVYIESYDDLLLNFKAIVKSFDKKTYVPKVKTFADTMGREFLEYLVSSIPGISKNISTAIGEKFNNFNSFYQYLVGGDCVELKDLLVWNDDKSGKRSLGKRQASLIRNMFLSDDPEYSIN